MFSNQLEAIYYQPHVIYDEATKKYTLWYNWCSKLWSGQFGVAICDIPAGPLKIVNDNVKTVRSDIDF